MTIPNLTQLKQQVALISQQSRAIAAANPSPPQNQTTSEASPTIAPPSQAEVLQVQQYISGLVAGASLAEDTNKAQIMIQAATSTAAAHGVQRNPVYWQNLSVADRIAYEEGRLAVIEACGCNDSLEEIRIRDNLRSLQGWRRKGRR